MTAMRIVISGYYGFSNIGDELILDATIALLEEVFDDPTVSVITYPRGDLESVSGRHGLTAVDGRDVAHCSALIGSADLLLVGGGGLIQDYLPADRSTLFSDRHANLVFWLTLASLARIHQTPVVGWQLGIGPLETAAGRQDASLFVDLLDQLFVRDEESLALVRGLSDRTNHVALGADPAITLSFERDLGPKRRVGVIVRSWLESGGWFDELARALDRLDPEAEVVFLPMQSTERHLEDDVAASRSVAETLQRDSTVIEASSPGDFLAEVARCTSIVSMRLHGALVAMTAGVPVVALSYDPKVASQMRRFGLERYCKSIHDVTADWLSTALTDAMELDSPGDAVDQAAAEVRANAAGLAAVSASDRPAPRVILEHLVAGRVVEVSKARRQLDETTLRNAELESENRTLQDEIDRLRTDVDQAREARQLAVDMYEELAGSRAVRLAATTWKAQSALRRALKR